MVKTFRMKKSYKLILLTFIFLILVGVAMVFYSYNYSAGARFGHTGISDVFKDKKERALVLAAARGKVDKVNALVKAGVDVNAVRKGGMTPLLWLVGQRPINLKGFEALLKHGANPNYIPPKDVDLYGSSVVYTLAGIVKINESRHTAEALDLALTYGGDPNIIDPNDDEFDEWQTVLMHAAHWGQVKNMKVLLNHGAKIDKRDKTGMTALLWAAYDDHYEAVYFLLQHGANYNVNADMPPGISTIKINPKFKDEFSKPIKINLSYIIGLSLHAPIPSEKMPWREKVIKWLEARGVPRPKPRAY